MPNKNHTISIIFYILSGLTILGMLTMLTQDSVDKSFKYIIFAAGIFQASFLAGFGMIIQYLYEIAWVQKVTALNINKNLKTEPQTEEVQDNISNDKPSKSVDNSSSRADIADTEDSDEGISIPIVIGWCVIGLFVLLKISGVEINIG